MSAIMKLILTDMSAEPQWGEKALLSFNQSGAAVHLSGNEAERLRQIQRAARRLDGQGIKQVALVGGEWDLERRYAFYQGFYNPRAGQSLYLGEMPTAEQQELANIKTKNIVPMALGAVLINTFRAFCLDGDPSVTARTARLRAAGYVPVGGWRNGVRRFVTDTSAPMVQISDDGGLCGVHARARTGQEAEIRQRIAQWFPKAQPVASDDPLQTIWTTGRAPNEGIGILRNPRGRGHNEISVALLRP